MFFSPVFPTLDEDVLTVMVVEMMRNNVKLPADPAAEAAMVAYLRALQRDAPFACLANGRQVLGGAAGSIRGETRPDSRVTVVDQQNRSFEARVADTVWTVTGRPVPPFRVIVQRGEQTTAFDFPAQQWTLPGQGQPPAAAHHR